MKQIVLLLLVSLGTIACGSRPSQEILSESESSESSKANVLSEWIGNAVPEAPAVGDRKLAAYSAFYSLSDTLHCRYHVNEDTRVTSVRGDSLRVTVHRYSQASATNKEICAPSLPGLRSDEEIVTTRTFYRKELAERLRNLIVPERILAGSKTVKSARILDISEVEYQGQSAIRAEVEIVRKSGRVQRRNVFLSLESEFLGILESTLREIDRKEDSAYDRTIFYSVMNGRMSFPR